MYLLDSAERDKERFFGGCEIKQKGCNTYYQGSKKELLGSGVRQVLGSAWK